MLLEQERRTFHEERMPGVVFLHNEEICSGMIRDFSDDGLNLLTDWHVRPDIGTEISALYLGELKNENRLEKLKVLRVRTIESNRKIILGLSLQGPEQLARFKQILNHYYHPPRNLNQPQGDSSRIPKISPKEHYTQKAADQRLEWLEQCSGYNYPNVRINAFRPESLAGNIENFIGAVQIPVGVAGPVKVNGLYAQGYFPLPVATSEGALVASLTRGCSILNKSGGVKVHVVRQKMLRAPVFMCQDLTGALNVENWIHQHKEEITQKAQAVSSVAKLIELKTFVYGNACHVQFYYQTGDAAGQNMTTSCTFHASEWIVGELAKDPYNKFVRYMIDGNMAGDKKANAQNFIEGRGVAVVAQAFVPGDIIREYLRTTPEELIDGYNVVQIGALQIGMMGHNVNFANVVAGIFASCGQDLASIHESSLGIFQMQAHQGGILYNAYLPSLVIGTVGGGTQLPTQLECLRMMGCDGQGKLFKFAEIIAAGCLALDISTSGAISSHEFVKAHEKLGRNRPQKKLGRAEINASFFQKLMSTEFGEEIKVQDSQEIPLDSNQGIVTNLVNDKAKGPMGILRFELTSSLSSKAAQKSRAVLKLKSSQQELEKLAIGLSRLSGEDALPGLFEQYIDIFGFQNSERKEIEFYKKFSKDLGQHVPKMLGSEIDPARELYAVLLEDLSDCKNIHTIDQLSLWSAQDIAIVFEDLASIQAPFLATNVNALKDRVPAEQLSLLEIRSPDLAQAARPLLQELLNYNRRRFPAAFQHPIVASVEEFIALYGERREEMNNNLITLSHHDFNPRNMCLRPAAQGMREQLAIYDWELACWQNPQRDFVEFLCYVANESWSDNHYREIIDNYIKTLENKTKQKFDRQDFLKMTLYNTYDLAANRMALTWLMNNVKAFSFLPAVTQNLWRLMAYLERVCL